MGGRLLLAAALGLGTVTAGFGCAAFDSTSSFLKDSFVDRTDPTEKEMVDEQWTRQVRKEGRGDRPVEVDPDGWWWGKYLMSAKAREIENDFNIDHGF